ncbi:MAG: hypothetical protein DCC50_14025, partial [Acidobacteria bacterium]
MSTRGSRPARAALCAVVCAGLALTSACDLGGGDGAARSDGARDDDGGGFLGLGGGEPDLLTAAVRDPGEPALVLTQEDAGPLSAAASQTFFDSAPVVVLAAEGEQLRAASAGAILGVPVLVDGPDVKDEINRLDAEVALAIGPVADPGIDVVVPQDDADLAELVGAGDPVPVAADDGAARVADLDPGTPQLLVPSVSPVAPETTGDTDGTATAPAPDTTGDTQGTATAPTGDTDGPPSDATGDTDGATGTPPPPL